MVSTSLFQKLFAAGLPKTFHALWVKNFADPPYTHYLRLPLIAVSKIETYREATGDAKYQTSKHLKDMTTLFNTSDFQLTAEAQPRSTRRSANKTSKISHPLAQGSTMYLKAQCALSVAVAAILGMYCGHANIISKETFANGTAQVIAEVWKEGENVLYQFDIDEDGDFCEIQL